MNFHLITIPPQFSSAHPHSTLLKKKTFPGVLPTSLHDLIYATSDGFRSQVLCFLLVGLSIVCSTLWVWPFIWTLVFFFFFFFLLLFPCEVYFLYLFIYKFTSLLGVGFYLDFGLFFFFFLLLYPCGGVFPLLIYLFINLHHFWV